ncbi:vacuolar sorting protein 28 [Guillardia theta CCMP2712]|uniref:Vacuolar sorting protein 28 n=1 Tax=Guillardia theta (strain CCMP2712) TaxID=905079 RepID=L1JZP9_GUITC|nr:vacuolar sorting protein 28 [Guillardia theta CCMP2712]EKX53764.1 vacuolar sorting protein 28 [Guillardia theta CCMP2712]|eukprot:XP_005840744.1 vacuolar sorting protein 28 [Guillardia theta CCMP2712]
MAQNNVGAHAQNDSSRMLASKASPSIKKELEKQLQVEDDSNRQEMESFADYYAIIRTMEKLETQYIRGTIAPDVYEKECQKLLPRFSTLKECLPSDMQNPAMAIPTFMSRYQLKAARAANRFATGVPATCSAGGGEDSSKIALFVAEAVQGFITLMDSLRLGMTAVDQVHPLTADVVNALNKIAQLPADFEPKMKVKSWLQILSAMRATEVLDEV